MTRSALGSICTPFSALQAMVDRGQLSQDEFEARRLRILDSI
jgi:hypothetical protein